MDQAEALFPADEDEEAVTTPSDEDAASDADTMAEAAVAGNEMLEAPMTDVDEDAGPDNEPDSDADAEPASDNEPDAEPDAKPDVPGDSEESAPRTLDEMVADLAGSEIIAAKAQEPVVVEPAEAAPEEPDAVAEPPIDVGGPAAEDAVPISAADETAPGHITDRMWTRAPFWAVFGLYPILTGVLVYLLWPAAAGAFTTTTLYRYYVLGGAGLVLVSLVTGLVVGLIARSRAGHDGRVGLARVIWLRTFAWTAAGVAVWWIGLVLLDLHHTGVI